MVKLFVFTLLALVLALLITLFFDLPSDPGYLLIAFGNYSFETSLVALIGLLLVFYILYTARRNYLYPYHNHLPSLSNRNLDFQSRPCPKRCCASRVPPY